MLHRNLDPLDLLASIRADLAAADERVIALPPGASDDPRWEHIARQAGRFGLEVVENDGPSGDSLRLRRAGAERPWRVGRIDDASVDDARALFERVFGHPISAAQWAWKYGEGRGTSIGAWRDGRLIAHYGGLTRDIVLRGKPSKAAQICDVIVEPAERGTLSRQGPLFLTAATYLEREIGPNARHTLGFGFPSDRHWRVAQRLGLYGGPAGKIVALAWGALPGGPGLGSEAGQEAPARSPGGIAASLRSLVHARVRELDTRAPADRAMIDACWQAMASDLADGIAGVRDANWVDYRYRAHPANHYQVFGVASAFTRRPIGVFVLRRHERAAELLDVVARPREVPALVDAARRVVGGWGLPVMDAWVTENIAHWFGDEATTTDPEVKVPNCAWTAGPPVDEIAGRWWLMGGDTDFR